ncbi:uncharacterized protein CBL_06639 [Carabus blaptoides fortunei]
MVLVSISLQFYQETSYIISQVELCANMANAEEAIPTSDEDIRTSIDTAKNIIIEHAYSEEQDISETQDESTSPSSSALTEDTIEEILVISPDGDPPEPLKPTSETKVEQVQEKVRSRELKSLLDAAKESNLDTNIVHKRESRKSIDPYSSKTSNDDKETGGKRTMRSQISDFSTKQQKFLYKVNTNNESAVQDSETQSQKRDKDSNISVPKTPKRKKEYFQDATLGGASAEDVKKRKSLKVDMLGINMKKDKDSFCWRCHREGILVQCETCPRGYHTRCLKQPVINPDRWPCPECLAILQAESTKTRSPAMRDMSLEHLCELLKYAAKRMMGCAGSEPFIHPVDLKAFPDYRMYVVQPMDLTTLQNNIRNNVYGSTIAFMADAKWILHNSIIYNSYQSKLTTAAKSIIKICKQEMTEIETCAECYQNANTKKNSWFVEVCSKPHPLLWAKLKGFPYWPAKAMITNAAGLVDVRFFGAHDRAWIPVKECFLYSKKDPNTTNKNKRNNIAECIKEVDVHIEKLKERFGDFNFAPYRTPYDPSTELEQLSFMLPKFRPSTKLGSVKTILTPIKIMKSENGEEESSRKRGGSMSRGTSEEDAKRSKSRTPSEISEGMRSDSRIKLDFNEDSELVAPSRSSKPSPAREEKVDKPILQFSSREFDKFMEGYGTEDDDTSIILESDVRKKLVTYVSDSDDEASKTMNSSISISEELKNGNEEHDDGDKSPESSSEMSVGSRGKVRTRGGYHNVTGKVKVLGTRPPEPLSRKRSITGSPVMFETPTKLSRRNSDMSSKSDSSRISGISDKINRVEEFSDTLEVSLANTSKDAATVSFSENSTPDKKSRSEFISSLDKADLGKLKPVVQVSTGDLYNKNKEFRISPQSKSVSIADRLMKKITEQTGETDKIETVKKQILDVLESSCSTKDEDDGKDEKKIDDVSSSAANIEKKSSQTEKQNESAKENVDQLKDEEKGEHSYSTTPNTDSLDKGQNVSSSTGSTEDKVKEKAKSEDENKETSNTTVEIKPTEVIDTSKKSENEKEKTEDSVKDVDKEKVSAVDPKLTKTVESKQIAKEILTDEQMEVDSEEEEDIDDEDEEAIDDDEEEETSDEEIGTNNVSGSNNKLSNNHVKLVNVSDIISGKINEKTTPVPPLEKLKPPEKEIPETIEIKSEPVSDEEQGNAKTDKPLYDVTLTVIEKQKKDKPVQIEILEKDKSFKVIDNITRVIDSVASNYNKLILPKDAAKNTSLHLNRKEITLRPISKLIQSPKQKARKSFPNSPHKMQQGPVQIKKIAPEPKKDAVKPATSVGLKVVSTLQPVPTQIMTTSTSTANKDNMVYIAPQTNSVMSSMALLPPNQPITLSQNVGSPIFAMVQHPGLNTPGLIIQQNPSVSMNTQMPSTSHCAIITSTSGTSAVTTSTSVPTPSVPPLLPAQPQTDDRSSVADTIAKAVGDLLCKQPPKLKPRPPGPLSDYFDEGSPSTAGPTTTLLNSVSHRLADYFRGLLKETLKDLAGMNNPESKIRSLELEIETLKQKHSEEMLEFRKNVSSVLKDIQKSIVEEKAKIVDETRQQCEVERVRCVDEAKAKQWCAFCLKEAQFYCCWNTSYCDYPCQQKHWTTHMKTCSQTTIRTVPPVSSGDKPPMTSISQTNKQLPKHTYGNNNKTVVKQTRMIVKPTGKPGLPMYVPVQRQVQGGAQTLTVVESTPGNFEVVNHGPISIGGKLIPSTNIKVKPGNIISIASSSSTITSTTVAGTQKAIILAQKPPTMINKANLLNKETENKT